MLARHFLFCGGRSIHCLLLLRYRSSLGLDRVSAHDDLLRESHLQQHHLVGVGSKFSGSSDANIKWVGSSGVISRMGDISTGIANIGTAITNAFSGEDFLTTQNNMDS